MLQVTFYSETCTLGPVKLLLWRVNPLQVIVALESDELHVVMTVCYNGANNIPATHLTAMCNV